MATQKPMSKKWDDYYDQENILEEILEEPISFTLHKEDRKSVV